MTLVEIVHHARMHKSFDVARARVTELYRNDPDFKCFVDMCLQDKFKEIGEEVRGSWGKTGTFCPKGADVVGWRQMVRELETYQDGSPMRARVRVSKIITGLDAMDRDDAYMLVRGAFCQELPFAPLALMDVQAELVVPKA